MIAAILIVPAAIATAIVWLAVVGASTTDRWHKADRDARARLARLRGEA